MAQYCGKCGTALREAAAFCGQCGTETPSGNRDGVSPTTGSAPGRNWLMPAGVAVATLAALAATFLYFTSVQRDNAAPDAPALVASEASVTPRPATFDVRAHCAANPNDTGPGEQDAEAIPTGVRAVGADFWRCAGGRVMVCKGGASGRACMQQVTVDPDHLAELERYCRTSPDSFVPNAIAGPGREWRCQGTMLVPDGNAPIDAYGFLVESWSNLD